ncbi:MAG TPA: sugar ABC transporter permease [Spirochaetia bacterium]|nr:sugar ABC transporter permease [Spirochaetia bacterium]
MNSNKTVHHRRVKRFGHYGFLPYVLIFPLVVFIGILAVYPTALTFIESFFNVNPLDPPVRFIGFGNYLKIFANPNVNNSWVNSMLYVGFGVVIVTVLAMAIAYALRENFPGRGIVLAIVVLPWALPGVTEGIIWAWIYNSDFGVLNSILKSLHIIREYQIWLSSSRGLTIFFIELVQAWQITPLATILILSSLQSIPGELYDAAKVDGAGRWRTFFGITVPLIRAGLSVAVVESVIVSLNIFDQVYVLNGNAATGSSIMLQTYNITFQNLNFGQGYALSFLAVMITMLISVGVLRLVYRRVEY